MAFGDKITRPGQIEWGDVLLDATGVIDGVDGVIDADGVDGLNTPEYRSTRIEVPAGPGSFAGLDVHGTRIVRIAGLQADGQAAGSKILRAMAPRGPSSEQGLAWQGLDWPDDRIFWGTARSQRPGGKFDAPVARGGMRTPDLAWEFTDPYAYDLTPQSIDFDPGDTAVVTSVGTWQTTRVTITWDGPITHPGISTSAVDGGQILFADKVLPDGEQIIARFHLWTQRTLRSSYFTDRQLGASALGGGPSASSPPPMYFPILVGDQTITALGTGAGSMNVTFYDAYSTPPAEA